MTNEKTWHADNVTVASYIGGEYNCVIELTRGAEEEWEVEAVYDEASGRWSVDMATCPTLTTLDAVRLENYLNTSIVASSLLEDAISVYTGSSRD